MGTAVLAHAQSGVGTGNFYVGPGVSHGIADLFIGPACAENGEGAGKGDIAGEGKARRGADHICLGNAEVVETVGKSLAEGAGLGRAGEIRVHNHDFFILSAQGGQSLTVGLSCGFTHQPTSNSLMAAS